MKNFVFSLGDFVVSLSPLKKILGQLFKEAGSWPLLSTLSPIYNSHSSYTLCNFFILNVCL
jgi:hypothetical protein